MDRVFRSLLNAPQVLEELDARGVNFHSLTDAIDTTTPMGRFAYQITNGFAELKRALIAERTRAGMEAARRRGVRIGRPPKLSEEQIEMARAQLAAGKVKIPILASRLRVSPRTLSRTINKKEKPP